MLADQEVYRPGSEALVWVEVENQGEEGHHLVVLNLLDGESAVYDSHERKEDVAFSIGAGEKRKVGPFRVKLPSTAGTYTLLAGYRKYPWEPLIAFQGASWCPPLRTIRVES